MHKYLFFAVVWSACTAFGNESTTTNATSSSSTTPSPTLMQTNDIVITTPPTSDSIELATLAGGCFWCVEAIYQRLEGVISVESGYSGGSVKNPSYREVCNGTTGHAEVVRIAFDPRKTTFEDILYVFWRTHDPTTLNRQGNDVGTQYRSAVFYHSDAQREVAERSLKETEASGLWESAIVTEISPLKNYFKAEDYHQNYFNDNRNQPYCRVVIDPKVRKFEKSFGDRLKKD